LPIKPVKTGQHYKALDKHSLPMKVKTVKAAEPQTIQATVSITQRKSRHFLLYKICDKSTNTVKSTAAFAASSLSNLYNSP
jgi:hypothetical protein